MKSLPRRNCTALLLFWLLAPVGARRTLWVSGRASEQDCRPLWLVVLFSPVPPVSTFTIYWDLPVCRALT